MALSGSQTKNVGSHWFVDLEWTATQNYTNNTSTITAKIYWRCDQYGQVNSTATKDGYIKIDGTTYSYSGAGLAKLSNNQKKLLHTAIKTINHNSDGSKSFTISGMFDPNVTLSGTTYRDQIVDMGSETLNTIPRESTLSSSANWTAGSDFTITISRASTSFSHEAEIYVKRSDGVYDWIKRVDFSTSQTSLSSSFSTAEKTEIFQHLAQAGSRDTKIIIQTFNGGTFIGDNTYYGTVTNPSASTTSTQSSFYVGDSFNVSINRSDSEFTHTIRLKNGSTIYKTYNSVGTSKTFYTNDIANSIYSDMPNDNSKSLTIECITYYNGVQTRSSTTESILALVGAGSAPTFSSSQISYADVNSTTTSITGNNQYIIQNKSSLRAYVNSGATGNDGATIDRYELTFNGETRTIYTTGYVTFGAVNVSSNSTLTIKAVDSRGNEAIVGKTVNIIPWSYPTVTANATRLNNFEDSTTISLSGSVSPLNVGGTNKNTINTVRYRYKQTTSSTYGSYTNFSYSGFPSYSVTNVNLTLDNLSAWHIQIEVSDKLGTTTVTKTVSTGSPILFMDSDLKSVGVNKFPENAGTFEVNGSILSNNRIYAQAFEARWVGGTPFIDLSNGSSEDYDARLILDAEERLTLYGVVLRLANGELKGIDDSPLIDSMSHPYGKSIVFGQGGGNTALVAGESHSSNLSRYHTHDESAYVTGYDVRIESNAETTSYHSWRFDSNGRLYHPKYVYPNGFNMLGMRDGTSSSDTTYLVQNLYTTVDTGGSYFGYADITFPTSFDTTPTWVVATVQNSQSYSYTPSIYSITSTGCRVYVHHVESSNATRSIGVQVVAGGRKASSTG